MTDTCARPSTATRYLLAGVVHLLLFTTNACAERLSPTQASHPDKSLSANEQTIALALNEAVLLGLRNNHAIRSAYFERIVQKFDLRVEKDRFTPKLVLSSRHLATRNQDDHYRQNEVAPSTTLLGEYGTQFSLSWRHHLTQANHAGRTHNDGATFSVIQPLLRGAGREVATAPIRLAELAEQVNRLNLKATVSSTVTQIITAYRELLRAQEQLRITREALARSRQLLDANKVMIASGRMAEFELVQTEADVATQELAVEEASNQLDASRLELLHLLALDLQTPVQAIERLDVTRTDFGLAEALAVAQNQQPTYLTQLIAIEQAAVNLTVARNERLWDLSLIGAATQARSRYPGERGYASDHTREGYAGLQVEIPIGDLSRRQAEVRARVNVETQDIRLSETRQLLERDVGDAVRNLGTRWRQYEIAQRARELSRRKLDIEREKLQAGRSSNFQVLSFEADLRTAESTRLNALIAYLNTQAQLDQTLGTTLESWDIDLND